MSVYSTEDNALFLSYLVDSARELALEAATEVQAEKLMWAVRARSHVVLAFKSLSLPANKYVVHENPDLDVVRHVVRVLHEEMVTRGKFPTLHEVVTVGSSLLDEVPLLFDTDDAAVSYQAVHDAAQTPFFEGSSKYVSALDAKVVKDARKWTNRKLVVDGREFRGSAYYLAPYFAVVNASMMGKSRMVTELSKLGAFVFSTCFRTDPNPLLFPEPTPFILDWVSAATANDPHLFVNQMCAMFHSCLESLSKWLLEVKRTGRKCKMMGLTEQWKTLLDTDRKDIVTGKVVAAGESDNVWLMVKAAIETESVNRSQEETSLRRLAEAWRPRITGLRDTISNTLKDIVDPLSMEPVFTGFKLLFFFDEARQFNQNPSPALGGKDIDRFSLLRIAMRSLPFNDHQDRALVFCIVADTTSKVSNVAPSESHSVRWSLPTTDLAGLKLHAPFTHVKTVDLWWEVAEGTAVEVSQEAGKSVDKYQIFEKIRARIFRRQTSQTGSPEVVKGLTVGQWTTIEILEDFEFNTLFGRPFLYPFFRSYCSQTDDPMRAADSLLAHMKTKLINSKISLQECTIKPLDMVCTTTQAIAVLGTLVTVEIYPCADLASDLTASSLQMIAAISEDRDQVFSFSVAEPVIALAARQLLSKGTLRWSTVLRKYAAELGSTTAPGFVGEVGFQVLAIMGWQNALRLPTPIANAAVSPDQTRDFLVIPVADFLEVLLGADIKRKAEKSSHLLQETHREFLEKVRPICNGLLNRGLSGLVGKLLVLLQRFPDLWESIEALRNISSEELEKILALMKHVLTKKLDFEEVWRLGSVLDVSRNSVQQALVSGINRQTLDLISKLSTRHYFPALGEAFVAIHRVHEAGPFPLSAWKVAQSIARLPDITESAIKAIATYFEVLGSGEDDLSFDEVWEAVDAQETLGAWEALKIELRGGFVRLYQFVKNYRKISRKTLVEFFIKGAGIACKEFERVIDVIIPIFFPDAQYTDPRHAPIRKERMSALGIQVKLQEAWVSGADRVAWESKFSKLNLVTNAAKAGLPSLGLFFEFGPSLKYGQAQDVSIRRLENTASGKRGPDGQPKPIGFCINSRGLTALDLGQSADVHEAFRKLLETAMDPLKSSKISDRDRIDTLDMFRRMPFLQG